jgi:hypothetical protein
MSRKKLDNKSKRKKVSITLNPEIYQIFEKYCKLNNIENYSAHIEKIIIERLKVQEKIDKDFNI